jgi:hypothetical protein
MPGLPRKSTKNQFNKLLKKSGKSKTNNSAGAKPVTKNISTIENMIIKFQDFIVENNINKSTPKFKKGDRCMYVGKIIGFPDLEILDDNMVVNGEPFWYDYDNHPNKGYWLYPIAGKANECPEDFLRLYNGQKEGDVYVE